MTHQGLPSPTNNTINIK